MSVKRITCVGVMVGIALVAALIPATSANLHNSTLEDTLSALVEDSNILSRSRRFVPFPSGSNIVFEFALILPTGASVGLSTVALATGLTFNLPDDTVSYARNYEQITSDRLHLYSNLESFLASFGYNGHACTLRTLCEVAESPFEHDLYGDLINLLLSASNEVDHNKEYDEYQLAEYYGKTYGDCGKIYPACPTSVLDTVSTAF